MSISARFLAMAGLAVLGCVSAAAPALAYGPPLPGPPPAGGPYAITVRSNVRLSGDVRPGSTYNSAYVPAQCWLEARFTNKQSWHRGDPLSYNNFTYDADTYWWSFANNEQNLLFTLGHIPQSRQQINKNFEQYQKSGSRGWWWAPAWLNDSQGLACAKALVAGTNLNNGYLDFEPPQTGGPATPGHTIDGQLLSELARAALALPSVSLHTNPAAPGRASEVNLPVWVWVSYSAPMQPSDMASVPLPGGGTLWAKVTTSRPSLSISVSDPGKARVYDNCGSTGSRYTAAQADAVPSCGVTFLAPSVGGPYTLTATVRWRVTWTDSAGGSGGFPSPPYPPSQVSRSVTVTVREIQSVNGGG